MWLRPLSRKNQFPRSGVIKTYCKKDSRRFPVCVQEQPQARVEFTLPNPMFWHVAFPPKDWTPRHPDAKSRLKRANRAEITHTPSGDSKTMNVRVRLRCRVRWCSFEKLCESWLSAHIIEDRSLTGKQYESVNNVHLVRVEVDLDSIPQLDRNCGPFIL
jgi:hypothetical protein